MKTNFFVRNFDLYGTGIKLNISGQEKVNTWLGSILGLITLLTILAFTMMFLTDLFQNKIKLLVHNKIYNFTQLNNLTNIPMMFSIVDESGNFIQNENLYSIEVSYTSYISENYNNIFKSSFSNKNNNFNFKLEKCTKVTQSKQFEKLFININLQNFFCIPQENYNLTLFGSDGDIINGFSSLDIQVKKCDKLKEICIDEEKMENKLSQASLLYLTLGYEIDHLNLITPQKPILQSYMFPFNINTGIIKRWIHQITPIKYVSDIGLFRKLKNDVKFFYHHSTFLDIDSNNKIIQEKISGNLNLEITRLSIRNSKFTSVFERNYTKLLDFLGIIGGVVNFLMIVFQFFNLIFTHTLVIEKVSKVIFNFQEVFGESKDIKYVKQFSDKFVFPSKNIVPTLADVGRKIEIPKLQLKNINTNIKQKLPKYNVTINFWYKLLPSICLKNKKEIKLLENCEKYIKCHLSVEYILRQFYNCESLVRLIIDENNIKDFLYDSSLQIPLNKVEQKSFKDSIRSKKSNQTEKVNGDINMINMSQSILHLQAANK